MFLNDRDVFLQAQYYPLPGAFAGVVRLVHSTTGDAPQGSDALREFVPQTSASLPLRLRSTPQPQHSYEGGGQVTHPPSEEHRVLTCYGSLTLPQTSASPLLRLRSTPNPSAPVRKGQPAPPPEECVPVGVNIPLREGQLDFSSEKHTLA